MVTIMAKWSGRAGALLALLTLSIAAHAADEKGKAKSQPGAVNSGPKVSYDKQIRPIFQAHCQGCHQPAKAGGGYVMTAFDRLLKGGDSGEPAIVPGQPEESYLVDPALDQRDLNFMQRRRAIRHFRLAIHRRDLLNEKTAF